MASSSRRMSQAPSSHVNLHCLQCDTQIGTFDNEWNRLTSSYVRPVHPGKHFGTEIALNKTQTVPEGTAQRNLQGCTLAEVFCTKCSAVVGQYCKAIPGPERRSMLKQYMYKLSKTCLKSGGTNEHVDPIFGYGWDLSQAPTRISATSRLSLPAVPRFSHTPFQGEDTPSQLHQMTEPYRRVSAPMSLQDSREPNALGRSPYGEREQSVPLQLVVQDTRPNQQEERWAALDTRMQENENQLRVISSVLDAFRGTLDDIKVSIKEIQSQNSTPYIDNPAQFDFMTNLHSMINAMKTARSNAQELEELRTENEALKAKWSLVQSAMATATGTPATTSPATVSHRNSLGKRKRDGEITKSTPDGLPKPAPRQQSFLLGETQVPTPQSSTYSQSQDTSNGSRSPTPDVAQVESHPQFVSQKSQMSKATLSQKAGKRQRSSGHRQPTETLTPAVRFALGDGSSGGRDPSAGVLADKERTRHSTSTPPEESSELSDQGRLVPTLDENATELMEGEPQPQASDDTSHPNDEGQLFGDDEPPMDVDAAETTGDGLPIDDSVEFSDDEAARPSSSDGMTTGQPEDPLSLEANGITVVSGERDDPVLASHASSPDNASTKSAPANRTRSKTKVSTVSTRRKTTGSDFVFAKDSRSLAPEPPSSRRILPRRLNSDKSGQFEHATPDTVEAELMQLEKPKAPRQYKPPMQTTTKILHGELKELGLEEWIDKDKNDPEYKKIVEEARARKREQTRLAALASRGVTVPGANMDEISQPSPPSLDEAFQQAQALANITNEKVVTTRKIPPRTATAAKRAAGDGSVTRLRKTKAERREEILKRDELAKAAMEE